MPDGFYQLFKSDLRGSVMKDQQCSRVTFNEGNYFHESRKPVGILTQFSEHYLSGTKQLDVFSETETLLILPVEGELCLHSKQISRSVCPQELFVTTPGEQLRISNDFPDEISRFYVFQLQNPGLKTGFQTYTLNQRNTLISCSESATCSLSIGVFDGRKDAVFNTAHTHIFTTVINGAFEVQNRLMETNDSLLAMHNPSLELEALSENAVILFFSF